MDSVIFDLKEFYDGVDEIKIKVKERRIIRRQKIGRNDLCPCGSGKKYKKCCLR